MQNQFNLILSLFLVSVLAGCGGGGNNGSDNGNNNHIQKDTTSPVITMLGDNPVIIEGGSEYSDAGVTAQDAVDGNLAVTVSNNVNASKVGEYTVEYSASDNSGNKATVSRVVIVEDTTAPEITILGGNPVIVEAGGEYNDAGVSTLDIVDSNITVAITDNVTVAKVGEYTVEYTATDNSGNKATASRKVLVKDTTAPAITLLGDNSITIERGVVYQDPGATALDTVDGNLAVVMTSTIDVAKVGKYTAAYTATDNSGNIATATREVIVADTIPPTITLKGESEVVIEYGSVYQDAGVTLEGDAVSSSVTNPVNTMEIGAYIVEYTAVDTSGNKAFASRMVTVKDIALTRIIEDQNLLNCLLGDGLTSASEVIEIQCNDKQIHSAKGIEFLKGLRRLELGSALNTSTAPLHAKQVATPNAISSIDLSQNSNLEWLDLGNNQLTQLDVSGNIKLEYVSVGFNQLTGLDVSHNRKLEVLLSSSNQLTNIELDNNVDLLSLDLSDNQFTAIGVSRNTKLESVSLYKNQLTEIDVSGHAELQALSLHQNQLKEIDVRNNINLKQLNVGDNQLTSIELHANTALQALSLHQNQLTEIDIRNNTNLKQLNVENNQLTAVELNANQALEGLSLYNNLLIELDVHSNTNLKKLNVVGNQLTTIDVSNNANLETLHLSGNLLTSVDVNNNDALTDFSYDDRVACSGSKCTIAKVNDTPPFITLLGSSSVSINYGSVYQDEGAVATDIKDGIISVKTTNNVNPNVVGVYTVHYTATDSAGNTGSTIRTVTVQDIALSSIIEDSYFLNCLHSAGLVNASEVVEVSCMSKRVSSAKGIEHLVGMKKLDLSSDFAGGSSLEKNLLTSIDLSKLVNLEVLKLDFNKFTDIDLKHNIKLETLYMAGTSYSNILTRLDVSQNVHLKHLRVSGNRFTSIDLSHNVNLETLNLAGNKINYIDLTNNGHLTWLRLDNWVTCIGDKCSIRD
ncbi:immunoglobulin-like domain-containing protein [Pseudoalteromonas aurantia]|uniref:Pesticidal crystal protein Cry22Aa Ig-like domain-containing protein n=1 Tax=Pseudoalteromonas aurantia 208 TaxID=1314867 RepID=A0ABR9E646_9GAMM|nr:immunoglobulin-like domain-containing protein [Pseudoalteromonas aurantia]MBE0366461.1 hypothetical protein [Pseudoalteromonas aurantia 208]